MKGLKSHVIKASHTILGVIRLILNPLIPKSDKVLISPYNITPGSNVYVMRIKEMIIN